MPENTPPWGSDEDFNPEKAWTLIQNLRAEVRETKAAADAATTERDNYASQVEELQATVQLTDDTAKTHEQTIGQLNGTVAKQALLSDHEIPLKYISLVTGETEDEWKASVDNLIELRGQQGKQERTPDPAQVAEPVRDEKADLAAQFFGK